MTEDAGLVITNDVYHTQMGYRDEGLTFVDPIFEEIVKQFPGICFEADVECDDGLAFFELHFSYDGEKLTKEGDDEIEF